MSAKATFWAWKQRGLSASEKLVLLCLSDCHNGNTGRCDPSVTYISDNTGLHRETVMKAINTVESKRRIKVEKRQGKRTNFFLLIDDAEDKTSTENHTSTEKHTGTEIPTTTSPEIPTTPVGKPGHEPISNLEVNLEIYKGVSLQELPQDFSISLAKEFIDYRIKRKPALSTESFNRIIKKACNASQDPEIGKTAEQIIEKVIDRGWSGFEREWLKSDKPTSAPNQQTSNKKPPPKAGTER